MQLPSAPFRRLVKMNSSPTTVYRRDDTTSNQYGTGVSYSELPELRDALIMGVSEVEQGTAAGQRQGGRLVAYTLPETDLDVNDRIDHGTDRYEVTAKVGKPNDNDPAVYRYDLERVDT